MPLKVVKHATDVTQERLRQADCKGQIAAIHKSHCVVAFNMDDRILDANSNFLDAVGYSLAEIKGQHHLILVEPLVAESQHYAEFWDKLREGAFLSAKFKHIGKAGKTVWMQASYNPILDLNGRPFKIIKIAIDVTAEAALTADLGDAKQQAQQDAATALPNRVRLASFMAAALAEPEARLAIRYLDLDHFKPINDAFGDHVGDHVLGETANRLRCALGPDQIAARIGGDEFVVAAPNLSDEEIEARCQKLISSVKRPIRHEKGALTVGLSIGIAVSPQDAHTADDLLRCADVALYRAKGNGRGSFSSYAHDMNERMAANLHLAEEMRHGIKAGQFFLEYQPRFNARNRKVEAVEALVLWAHPSRGRLEPSDFLLLAEKSGLILPLGEWVLRTAAHAALGWPQIGMSVTLSPVQFKGSDVVETVGAALSDIRLEPDRLELEITEEALIEDEEQGKAKLEALKALGLRLSMDRCKIRTSSLKHLHNFPFDTIKIEQRFLADLNTAEGDRAIVQAILKLGKGLGAAVTAEGFGTGGQILQLKLDEYSELQGFLFAPPMSRAEVSQLLERDPMALVKAG